MIVRCGRRSCPACGVVWIGDQRIRAVAASEKLRGAVALVSVTAPGADVLPWDASGTRVRAADAKRWNDSAPSRWRKLHRAAATRARRCLPDGAPPWRVLFRCWEYQKRGALHAHLVVPFGSPLEVRASTEYVRALAELRHLHGFGFVDRGRLPAKGRRQSSRTLEACPPGRAARYVASYVSSSGAGKGGILEVAQKQGAPGSLLHITPSLTRASGVTMRSLRLRRAVLSRYPNACSDELQWRAACVLTELGRGRMPLAPDSKQALMEAAMAQGWSYTIDARTGEVRGAAAAARPPLMPLAEATVGECSVGGVVRLDSVLHGGHEGVPQVWRSRAEVRGRAETYAHSG